MAPPNRLSLRELILFSLLGVLMYISKILLEFLPNVHLLAVLTTVYTICYRKKALYPIYIYVLINGLFAGFSLWWIPYLYLWTLLWGAVMLLPQHMKKAVAVPVYMVVCALHGFLFGTLYAPAQALMFGLNFRQMLAWIVAGLPFDLIHGVSNFFAALLVVPLTEALRRAEKIQF